MSAAIYAARAKLSTLVLDKGAVSGALGMASRIDNYPGVPQSMAGRDLLSAFRGQAEVFGAETVRAQVIGVDFERWPKEVITAERVDLGRSVIIATGAMGRKPVLEGEARLIGRGVSYCAACDAAFYADEDVAMAGKVDGLLEEIDSVAKYARKVYACVYSNDPTSEQLELLDRNPRVESLLGCRVKRILGETEVEGLVLSDPDGGERALDVSGVFLYLHGAQPVVDYLLESVEIEAGCIKANKDDMSTSVEGVYAVGDVTCKKIRQTVIAAAEGCVAALSADRYLNKRRISPSQWSSAM